MDTVDAKPPQELEHAREHPLNMVDGIFYSLATTEFADNLHVREALRGASMQMLYEAQRDIDFSGENYRMKHYRNCPKDLLCPTGRSCAYAGNSLEGLDPFTSEQVAEAIAKKLGAIPEDHTLRELEDSEVWQPHVSARQAYRDRWISIPITGGTQNPPLSRDITDLRQYQYPVIDLVKHYADPAQKVGRPGVWSVVVHMIPSIFDQSIDLPLTPSKFSK